MGKVILINVDARYLDWVCAVFLAQDEVGIEEIRRGFDLHTDNKEKFGLPSRLIAKVFLFRLIFGGTAGGFAYDADFDECKFTVKQWEEVIEKFYRKYKGIHSWHQRIVKEATTKKKLSIPTGRSWKFEMVKNRKGELEWPITQIKNYIVQGLEADMMMLTRVTLYNRIKHDPEVLMINSVHDSILIDCPTEKVDWVCKIIASSFKDVPANFERLWKVPFNIPFRGEIQVGMDYENLTTVEGLEWD